MCIIAIKHIESVYPFYTSEELKPHPFRVLVLILRPMNHVEEFQMYHFKSSRV